MGVGGDHRQGGVRVVCLVFNQKLRHDVLPDGEGRSENKGWVFVFHGKNLFL